MCHSCGSRNPGCFVPAAVFLLGKRELQDTFWIPAFAGMTPLSRLRFVQPASPTRGEAGCFIRLNSYIFRMGSGEIQEGRIPNWQPLGLREAKAVTL